VGVDITDLFYGSNGFCGNSFAGEERNAADRGNAFDIVEH
jgi:hypothetical protein